MSSQLVAVVTGGNKGIGFAIVRALCKQFKGAIYLTARDEGRGKNAVKELEAEGLKPKFHLLDITDKQSVDTMRDYLVKNYGGVDVFVHNAGMAFKGSDSTPFSKQATVTIAANFTGAVYVINTMLPIMKENGRVSIVSSMSGTSSLSKCSPENQAFFKSDDLTEENLIAKIQEFVQTAQTGDHTKKGFSNSAYGMSKLGLTAFTRIVGKRATQLDQSGVLVNCCCPGYVDTDMTSHRGHKTPDQGAVTPMFLAMIPIGKTNPNGEFLSNNQVIPWYK